MLQVRWPGCYILGLIELLMRVQGTVPRNLVIQDLDDYQGPHLKVVWLYGFGTLVHPIVEECMANPLRFA